MAQWHLDELRSALERRGWRLTGEIAGDDVRISGTWAFERSGAGPREIMIDFDGLDDGLNCLPMAESYACRVRGMPQSLYFRRRGEAHSDARARWQHELTSFVASLDDHAN